MKDIRRRFFEITVCSGRKPLTYVEYIDGFGEWVYRSKIYRWEYVDRAKGIYWFIGSDLVVDNHHVIANLKQRMNDQWATVNLATVSNPKSARQPAMGKKGRK